MTSLMRYLLDPQFVVMALAAIAAFATITSFVLPLLSGDRLGSRMKYVAGERERLRAQHMAHLAKGRIPGKIEDGTEDLHEEGRRAAQPEEGA